MHPFSGHWQLSSMKMRVISHTTRKWCTKQHDGWTKYTAGSQPRIMLSETGYDNLLRLPAKKTQELHITDPLWVKSIGKRWFPPQKASYTESVSISRCHYEYVSVGITHVGGLLVSVNIIGCTIHVIASCRLVNKSFPEPLLTNI